MVLKSKKLKVEGGKRSNGFFAFSTTSSTSTFFASSFLAGLGFSYFFAFSFLASGAYYFI